MGPCPFLLHWPWEMAPLPPGCCEAALQSTVLCRSLAHGAQEAKELVSKCHLCVENLPGQDGATLPQGTGPLCCSAAAPQCCLEWCGPSKSPLSLP